MAAGVPSQPRWPNPAEGEEQRGGENRQGKNTPNTEPSHEPSIQPVEDIFTLYYIT